MSMYIKTILLIILLFDLNDLNFQLNEVNKAIFTLINDGLTDIHPHPSKKAILLVGLNGAGKTTLAKFITGDNNRLMSVAVEDDYNDIDGEELINKYYVKDMDDDKIWLETTVSRSLYPEIYVDQTYDEVIIDCPGFESTRRKNNEIAIKRIFSWATQVKVIVIVNHTDVRTGCSCNEFLELLRFLSILLKDVSHFHTSIGMIVTKVINEYVNDDNVATDIQMINQIAEYLSLVKTELIESNSDDSNIVLMDSLLKQIGPNYPNIAIFRKPYESGSLKSISKIQAGKNKIREMLYSNLLYANVTESSAGFSISECAELDVITKCAQIKKNVDTKLQYLNKKFRQHYQNQIDQARNYDELRDLLQKEKNCFDCSELAETFDFESQLKIFFDILTTNKLHTYLNSDAMYYNFINQLTHLKLLQKSSNFDLTKSDPNWLSIVPELVQHLVSLSDWYNFIVTTFERMSQNDVQANKANLSSELASWDIFKTYAVTELDLKIDPNVMKKLTLEVYEQKSLIDILKVISEPPTIRQIKSETNKCEIIIEGYFVRTSDIETLIKPYDNKSLSAVHVFAQYTVFFDSSINKEGSELLLSVIAPKWETIDQQTINLNGINATSPECTVQGDGDAGQPGGQAGTFFGVGYDFVNGECLSIFTNGGTGGNGQDGGKGRNGHDDIDVKGIKINIYPTTDRNVQNFTHEQVDYVACYWCNYMMTDVNMLTWLTAVVIEVYITSGPEAMPGFDGGRQGLGGINGITSDIISLNGLQIVSLLNSQGANGKPGKGGKGGRGAIVNGKVFLYAWELVYNFLIFIYDHRINGIAKPNAADGLDNHSGELVEPKKTIHLTHPIASRYRRFLIERTTDPTTVNPKLSYKVFLNFLNNNEKIIEITDLNDLVYEFIALEELNQKRSGIQELTFMYDMLLKLIENCAEKERKNKPETFLITANYLYAAILSRKLNIKSGFSDNFVIDVSGFVDHIKGQIETFTNLNQEVNVKALQILYNEDIVKKEKDGNDFIAEQFGEEMAQINFKIKTAILSLNKEINLVSKNLKSNKEQVIKDMKNIKACLIAQSIFSVMKTLASILTPEHAVVGSIINVGISIGSDIIKNETPNPRALLEDTNSFKLFKNKILQNYNEKTDSMISHIGSIVSSNPEVQTELVNIRDKVIEMAANNTSLTIIYAKFEEMISSSNKRDDDTLKNLGKSLKFAYFSAVESYSQFEELAAGLNEAEQVKLELDIRISKLHAYENSVHDSLHTKLKKIMSEMKSTKDRNKDVSTVVLEISRYSIKNALKVTSDMIKSFTSDFKANEDLVSCIESLENLMITTMNVIEHLQTYNDQRNLGNLITNINTVKASGLHTGDDRLDTAIRQLDHMLVSNTIQNQYLRAVHAFQQLVFPFAPFFFDKFQLSSDFSTINEFENIRLVISKIKNLHSIIKNQQSSVIRGYDDQIFTNRFDESKPFFVWDTTTNSQSIDNLLKGHEITLKADVLQSVENAVKFNDIRLKLVSTDNNQMSLDTELANFDIKMTHMGNSRYRCGDNFFIIANQPQIIEYSFAVKETGAPLSSNFVHQKISGGNFLLSPYALWKFQLVKKRKDSTNLSQFFGKIKLVLLGEGQFVKPGSPICQRALENYYQIDEVTTKIYNQRVIDGTNFSFQI